MLSSSSSGVASTDIREVPTPQSKFDAQDGDNAALLLARIQQLEKEKVELEEKNAVQGSRILELEEENARLKCSQTGQGGKGDIGASKKQSTRLSDVLLLESMLYLERWDLDGMPLVDRQFLRVAAPFEEAQTSRLQQRRMIDRYVRNTESLKQAGPNSLFDHRLASHSHVCQTLERRGKCAIILSDEALLELIQRDSPHPLRATRSVIHCHESHNQLERFASLWDGCALEVYENHKEWGYDASYRATSGHFSPEMVVNCSSLLIGHLHDHCDWRGPTLGDPSSGIPRCSKVAIAGDLGNHIFFSDVVDYLFASIHDGRKRELEILTVISDDPESLIALIKERMSSCASEQVPAFSLKLVLVPYDDHERMLGTFELLSDRAAASDSQGGYGNTSEGYHHCTYTVGEEGDQDHYLGRRKVLRIKVDCA